MHSSLIPYLSLHVSSLVKTQIELSFSLKMPVRHTDLAPSRQFADLGSKTGAFLMVLSILCGLCSFVLCLVAETNRSVATWVLSSADGEPERYDECVYSGNGKVPLLCSGGAFLSLAFAMVMEHAYMLVAVSKATPPALIAWDPDRSRRAESLTFRAAVFFVTTWICFAVAEVLLMIGIGVESGHLTKWSRPRPSCLVVNQGLFLAAGVFGLTTVFLVTGLYLTALTVQRLQQEEEEIRRDVINTAMFYASPPRSPPPRRTLADVAQISLPRQEHHDQQLQLRREATSLSKSVAS